MIEPFKTFFDYYEELRNASVHYSPDKEQIWMKPDEWFKKASLFSKLALDICLLFWKSCYPLSEGPEYFKNFPEIN